MSSLRTFIAVQLPPVRPLLALLGELRGMGRAVRPVAPDHLHLTIRFLGQVDAKLLPDIAKALRNAAAASTVDHLSLQGVGVFPNERRPTVVWAGIDAPQQLIEFHDRLSVVLADLGFAPDDRDFRPHLTLARIKARPPRTLAHFLAAHREASIVDVRVKAAQLMNSQLTPRGPNYSVHSEAPFKGHTAAS